MRLRPVRGRLLLTLVVALVVLVPAVAVGQTALPTFLATFGGPEHADMYPSGVEVGSDGTIVVADTGNNRVSKYRSDGTKVWSVGRHGSGTGQFDDPRDVGVDANGDVYVADTRNSRIVKLDRAGRWLTSWTGPAVYPMSYPLGVTATGDNVYVADTGMDVIRVFDHNGRQIRQLPSQPACPFSGPRDADADAGGNVYVANYRANNIVRLTPSGACSISWGSVGSEVGQFKTPYGVRVARDPVLGTQAVYVADANNNRIQEFRTDGSFVATAGSAGEGPGTFFQLRRVAVTPRGDVWGADLWGLRIERFRRTSTGYAYAQTIGRPLPPPTDHMVFEEPHGIAFESNGNVDVVDTVHHRFARFTSTGQLIGVCGSRGSLPGMFNWPRGIAVDWTTGNIWVADTKQHRLQIVQPDCTPVARPLGKLGTGLFNFDWPYSIAIRNSDHTAWIADTFNNRVVIYDVPTHRPIAAYGIQGTGQGQFQHPSGIAISPITGHVFVADAGNNRVVELKDVRGKGVTMIAHYGTGLDEPNGVAVDRLGRIYVADSGNNRVVVLSPTGIQLSASSGPSGFDSPENLAVSGDRLFVADTYNSRVQVYRIAR